MNSTHLTRFALPAAFLLLAACARTEEASLVPPESEDGYNAVEKVRTPERDDDDVAIGEWRTTVEDDAPALAFGPLGAAPLFSIRCDERRGLILQRHGTVATGELPMMLVQVGSDGRRLPVTAVGGTVPMLRASIPPSEELVGNLAGADAPITVRVGDAPALVMPPDPALGAFIEQCRTGAAAAAPVEEPAAEEAPAEANATG